MLEPRVLELEEAVAHTQLSGNKSQWIAGGFGCQCRRTAQTRIDFNHAIILAHWVEGVLNITFAHDADVTDYLDRERTQFVILAVGKRLRRGYNDRLASVDAQRVKVLHVTYGDTVVIAVAHHLIFYLLPSLQTLLDEHLGRKREGLLRELVQLVLVVGKSTAESAQRIGCTYNHGVTQCSSGFAHLLDILAGFAANGLDINLIEFLYEKLAVLGIHNGLDWGSEHTDIVLLEHSALIKLHATVERGLPAERQQYSLRSKIPSGRSFSMTRSTK